MFVLYECYFFTNYDVISKSCDVILRAEDKHCDLKTGLIYLGVKPFIELTEGIRLSVYGAIDVLPW